MQDETLINEEKPPLLTPVNEFLTIMQKRYNSGPNSLAAGGYRQIFRQIARDRFQLMSIL